jgi:hypothetical protein
MKAALQLKSRPAGAVTLISKVVPGGGFAGRFSLYDEMQQVCSRMGQLCPGNAFILAAASHVGRMLYGFC